MADRPQISTDDLVAGVAQRLGATRIHVRMCAPVRILPGGTGSVVSSAAVGGTPESNSEDPGTGGLTTVGGSRRAVWTEASPGRDDVGHGRHAQLALWRTLRESPTMCLVFTLLLAGPRAGALLWWLFAPGRWDSAFDTIIFLGNVTGWDWMWLAFGLVADVSMDLGGGYGNRNRVPGYSN
jgi:hypothetical protein